MDSKDLSGFSGFVPLFPLPNVVLFPEMVLPLHIFEPRYREMTARVLDGERLLAMALLKPGWERDYYGNPPVHDVIGVGRIVQDKRLDDGRYHFLLIGLRRARIREVVSEDPYRTARVELLEDRIDPAHEQVLKERRAELLSCLEGLASNLAPDVPVGVLCDVVSATLVPDIAKKQSILEELDVSARAKLVLRLVQRRKWPPEPSDN